MAVLRMDHQKYILEVMPFVEAKEVILLSMDLKEV